MNLGTLNADGTYTQANGQTTISTAPSTSKTSTTGTTGTGTGAVSGDAMVGTPETGKGWSITINLNGAQILTSKNMQGHDGRARGVDVEIAAALRRRHAPRRHRGDLAHP